MLDGSVYNPEGLVYSYSKLAHGKARADAIRYYYMFLFCIDAGDGINAAKCFKAYKSCPVGDRECKGCSANAEIEYYLHSGEKEKADSLALKIENGILRCKDSFNSSFSLLRMKRIYLKYYICHGDYENAAKCAYILEHSSSQEKDFNPWAFIMCAYVYSKPGRAMRIYKKHWQEWEEERNPIEKFFAYKCVACFFKGLGKLKGTDTVKIRFSGSFPLYNADNVYKVCKIIEYYYKGAEKIAAKFDQRNGTHKFIKELEMTFANVL